MQYLVVVGRILFSLIFLLAGMGHFSSSTVAYAQAKGVPLASILVPLSGVLAMVGAVSIMLGYKAKWGAWFIVLFIIPVTIMMHDFWNVTDPMQTQVQMSMFMKNLSILGAALLINFFGSGPFSLDNRIKKLKISPP